MARRAGQPLTVAIDVDAPRVSQPRTFPWPWYAVAVLGALAVLLAGWVVLGALTVIGWVTSPEADLSAALRLAGALLVLAHGGTIMLDGQALSIAPLGITVLLVFLAIPIAAFAARQAAHDGTDLDDTGRLWIAAEATVLRVGATFAGSYTIGVGVVAFLTDAFTFRALFGGLVVGVLSGLIGAARGVGFDPTKTWPQWVRILPHAMSASLLTILVGSGVALLLATWAARDRIGAIATGLDGGWPALILLAALQLAYLPNLLLATASWLLGAGITLGEGSYVTLTGTDVGLLPAIPVFGLVPEPGPASSAMLWWLLVGVAAGALAGLAVALARPRARFDETALVGGLAGLLAGLLLAVACGLATGGLGSGLLAHVGASAQIFIFAPSILGLSGMVTGLAVGLVRRPPGPDSAEQSQQPEAELTPLD